MDVNTLLLKIKNLETENLSLKHKLASVNNNRHTSKQKKNHECSNLTNNNEAILSEDDALSCITTFSYESDATSILTSAFSKYMNQQNDIKPKKTKDSKKYANDLNIMHHNVSGSTGVDNTKHPVTPKISHRQPKISTPPIPNAFSVDTINHFFKHNNNNTKYTIQRELGRGAFGTVYLIKLQQSELNINSDEESNDKSSVSHLCAMKIVKNNDKYLNRETKIIRFLQKNTHENIVPFYKYYTEIESNGIKKTWIYMKYVHHTLSKICESMWGKKKTISKDVHKNIMRQLACALQFIHHHNICHRDLKPDNILVDKSNMHIYLCDFGCSKFILPDNHLKNETYICSRFYRAPELIIDRNLYSTKIDVWSYGCIFIELCVSRILFMGKDNLAMLVGHIRLMGKITEIDIRSMLSTISESDQFPVFPDRESNWSSIFKKRTFGPEFELLCPKILCFNINNRYTMTDILQSQYFVA